jgi:hypothetical protein
MNLNGYIFPIKFLNIGDSLKINLNNNEYYFNYTIQDDQDYIHYSKLIENNNVKEIKTSTLIQLQLINKYGFYIISNIEKLSFLIIDIIITINISNIKHFNNMNFNFYCDILYNYSGQLNDNIIDEIKKLNTLKDKELRELIEIYEFLKI